MRRTPGLLESTQLRSDQYWTTLIAYIWILRGEFFRHQRQIFYHLHGKINKYKKCQKRPCWQNAGKSPGGQAQRSQRSRNVPWAIEKNKVISLIYDHMTTMQWKFGENRSSRPWDDFFLKDLYSAALISSPERLAVLPNNPTPRSRPCDIEVWLFGLHILTDVDLALIRDWRTRPRGS